jgi:hypothetical protein
LADQTAALKGLQGSHQQLFNEAAEQGLYRYFEQPGIGMPTESFREVHQPQPQPRVVYQPQPQPRVVYQQPPPTHQTTRTTAAMPAYPTAAPTPRPPMPEGVCMQVHEFRIDIGAFVFIPLGWYKTCW